MELEKLLKAYSLGDADAFHQLFDKLYPKVYSFITGLILDREDARDITADVFVKVWQRRGDFKTFEKFKAFVFVSARNACYDYFKDKASYTRRQKEFLYSYHQSADNIIALPPFAEMERAEIKGDVYEYLLSEIERLPDQCRKVFQLSYFDGMKNKEIAHSLGITDKTVRNQKVLAIKMLRMAARSQYLLSVFIQFLLL